MLLYFFIVFTLYYLIVGIFIWGWQNIRQYSASEKNVPSAFISVVVVVRNEEKNIVRLLEGIERQNLSEDQFELIIVDDQSDDKTVEFINQFLKSTNIQARLLQYKPDIRHNISPKKSAIALAIAEARGEIIAVTDGDCRVCNGWLKSILHAFDREEVKFVSGPVVLQGIDSLFGRMQTIEFASLIGAGAALINFNYPLMCNGANLAFRKSAFIHVNGYLDNVQTSTGDDVFLMQKIHTNFKKSVNFLKNPQALVYTDAEQSISSLIQQRKRWASKWNKNLLPFSWILPVFLFIHYITFLFGIIAMFVFPVTLWLIGPLIVIKFVADYMFLKKVLIFCKLRLSTLTFLLCELLYPFYAVFFGVIVHFGKFKWKGRTFKK